MKVLLTAFFAITVALADDTILLRLYNSSSSTTTIIKAQLDAAEIEIFSDKNNYNRDFNTVFIFFGFNDLADLEGVDLIVNAFLKRGGINVITVDWRRLSTRRTLLSILPPYINAGKSTQYVGREVFKLIQGLEIKGLLTIDNLILVGHSLGAHICGVIGRSLRIRPPLIIGLDPAGPLFSSKRIKGNNQALLRNDADIVQVVYTDSGSFGTDERNGNANFIANAGKRSMPGCAGSNGGGLECSCSHGRAYDYFAEAVLKPGTFKARSCKSLKHFIAGHCSENVHTFGYPVDTSANGMLYFETNSESPYGKGQAGTVNQITYTIEPSELDFL